MVARRQPQESPDRFAPSAATARAEESPFKEQMPEHVLVKDRAAHVSNDPMAVGGPMPKSIGKCADFYNDVRALRLAMDKEVEAVKARESEIREYIIANLSKSEDTGAAGLRYRAQIVMKDQPRAVDWPALWAFIAKNNRFDLLQKRLGEKAVMDMVEQGEKLPGVEVIHIPDVSITKI